MEVKGKPMLAQYLELKEQYKDSVLLFQVGNFYQLYYHDAQLAEEALSLKRITRNVGDGKCIPMCGIPSNSLRKHGEALAGKGYRVVVCGQKAGCTDARGITVREVTEIIEPTVDQIDLTQSWDEYLQSNTFAQQPYKKVNKSSSAVPTAPGEALVRELSRLELGTMTPIAALDLLYEWKRKYLKTDV